VLDFEFILFMMGNRPLLVRLVIHLLTQGLVHLLISRFSVRFRGQLVYAELLLLLQAVDSSIFLGNDGLADFALVLDESFGLHFGV